MLTVRKTLTEILLEVTNEEIQSIGTETCTKFRTRGRFDNKILSFLFFPLFFVSYFFSLFCVSLIKKYSFIYRKFIEHSLSARLH